MSWRRIALFSGVGIVAYLFFLALTLPASMLFRWVLPANGPIAVVAPQGTPWHGQAHQLRVNGAVLGRVSWSVHPWALFTGKLDYDLRVHGAATELTGEAVLAPGGKIVVTNVHGPLDLTPALGWLHLPANSATGRITFDLDRFVMADNHPTALVGRITVDHLHAQWPQPMDLGGYVATFTTDANGIIHGRAHDSGGPIDLDATVTVSKNGQYQCRGTMTARGNAAPGLKQALGFLGRTDNNGATHFAFSGNLTM
ncbi:MAG TPA: type II secretion system protein N [Gammaproteobacteria bacterium]|nr:type II secretion system protein N [Gammaproteobacteria bacterium]